MLGGRDDSIGCETRKRKSREGESNSGVLNVEGGDVAATAVWTGWTLRPPGSSASNDAGRCGKH